MSDFVLRLPSELSAEELTETLKQYEPWGMLVEFDNGVSTADFARRTPFNERPLQKISRVAGTLDLESLRGGRVLDVGCNSGHNSIHAALTWGLKPTGIDFSPRHVTVSTLLAEAAGVEANFVEASAEDFVDPDGFDLIMHFGTLYHLPNPLLAIDRCFQNVKPGGYLALETQVYDHPDDENISYFMHMFNNDPTNFWALSTSVLTRYLGIAGFEDIQILNKVQPKRLMEGMSRIILVARKPS